MSDRPIKCTRCKRIGMHSELEDVYSKKYGGCYEKVCPKCSCRSYYDYSPWFAWCWPSGVIEMGSTPPADKPDGSGCIVFAGGPRCELEGVIRTVAQRDYRDGTLLIPGTLNADADTVEIVRAWIEQCELSNAKFAKRGVRFLAGEGVV